MNHVSELQPPTDETQGRSSGSPGTGVFYRPIRNRDSTFSSEEAQQPSRRRGSASPFSTAEVPMGKKVPNLFPASSSSLLCSPVPPRFMRQHTRLPGGREFRGRMTHVSCVSLTCRLRHPGPEDTGPFVTVSTNGALPSSPDFRLAIEGTLVSPFFCSGIPCFGAIETASPLC